MAAKALTELSYSSKCQLTDSDGLDNELMNQNVAEEGETNSQPATGSPPPVEIKEEPTTTVDQHHCSEREATMRRNDSPCNFEDNRPIINSLEDLRATLIANNLQAHHKEDFNENILNLQQRLETAAVLMDISKKVVISPPCSNPESPSICIETDPSIINSVIKLNRPSNNHRLRSSMMMKSKPKKKAKFDLAHLSNILMSSQRAYNPSSIKNFELNGPMQIGPACLFDCNVSDNKRGLLTAMDSEHSSDSNRLEVDINTIAERRSPESIASEDHGTDAATTQLWQALAQSAGKRILHFIVKTLL